MTMRWEDERYVRVYTRDTIDWLGLSFIAQGLFCLLLRKVDRAGLLKLGKAGRRGVAIIIGFAGDWERLEPALEELLADGCVQIRGEYLVVPNFIEAQEATMSDALRKRESRARARELAAAELVLNPDKTSGNVTDSHESGQKVTSGHEASQAVTPNLAVPSRAEPPMPKRGREALIGLGHPAFGLIEHWTKTAWPKRSSSPCSDVTTAQAQRLAELAVSPGQAETKARMDRAVVDPFWRDKLDLDLFLAKFDRFASKAPALAERRRRAVGVDEQGQPIFEEVAS